ncbi:formate dehydrogenase accessory sulfurtransferase FdhD [Streptomyces sp. S.PB5]|uniref:formate dehydrogenase accessory sulfurtransferase FdhD n=1 Tax=Streptomyces sp. S.PB5 TaxID=3020844 RepID=UPI0025B17866|nr:formate dehydrogenase accessory sulfurtransferase FdhD [Streptomyces sp. S.PB5]MDN3027061.1 formate dehydrogenase accessory sulfurtransferase FdhD [Streptomyces sp. S.PB5]
MGRAAVHRRVVRVRNGNSSARADTLAVEEPLEIRLNGAALAITMRTPGDDFALAAGFLVSEGVLASVDDLRTITYCAGATQDGVNTYNVVDVSTAKNISPDRFKLQRNFYTTSSCGLCGKTSLDAVRTTARWPMTQDSSFSVSTQLLASMPDRLRQGQKVFSRTGGLHAAGLFDERGELMDLQEDVGRHNAVDKLIGRAFQKDLLPLARHVLMVSGRASFELVQKAVMAGIPVLAAVSAPSSLACELADDSGMTLVGFLRGESMNIYAGDWRITD